MVHQALSAIPQAVQTRLANIAASRAQLWAWVIRLNAIPDGDLIEMLASQAFCDEIVKELVWLGSDADIFGAPLIGLSEIGRLSVGDRRRLTDGLISVAQRDSNDYGQLFLAANWLRRAAQKEARLWAGHEAEQAKQLRSRQFVVLQDRLDDFNAWVQRRLSLANPLVRAAGLLVVSVVSVESGRDFTSQCR